MWPVFGGGGFSPGRSISAGDLAGGGFLGSAVGAKKLGAEHARTRAILG